jgi:hypothetical protein
MMSNAALASRCDAATFYYADVRERFLFTDILMAIDFPLLSWLSLTSLRLLHLIELI